MKKTLALFVLSIVAITTSYAQEIYNSSGKLGAPKYSNNRTSKGFDKNRLIFGGGLGFTFGSITNVHVSPTIGYRFTDRLGAGISLGFNYFRQRVMDYVNLNNEEKSLVHTQTMFSGGIWGRFLVFENLFLHGEFELNNWDYVQYDQDGYAIIEADNYGNLSMPKNRTTVPSLLLGAGYRQPITEFVSLNLMVMYDVIQDLTKDPGGSKRSPYANRLDFRMGVSVGF